MSAVVLELQRKVTNFTSIPTDNKDIMVKTPVKQNKMTLNSERPDVFQYNDFRQFLRDMFAYHKSVSSAFSQRYVAKKVMAGSAGWFLNVTSGRIALTDAYTFRLAKLFVINGREFDYFNILVKFGQSSSIEEKEYYLAKIYEFKGEGYFLIGKNLIDYYQYWYISAIRELLMVIDDDGNPERIGSLMRPEISSNDASNALKILKSLGLINMTAKGKLKPTNEIVRKDPAFSSVYWVANMESKLKLALHAVTMFKKEERDFSEVVVPLSVESMEEVKMEIELLRKKILSISKNDRQRNMVVQCSFLLFPLSKQLP
jgi:uncharacterized protein (TIGR02147 family)